jgi:hypothetical protein
MSSQEYGQTQSRYVFKGRFGGVTTTEPKREEPSKSEIDAFVREALGILITKKPTPDLLTQ